MNMSNYCSSSHLRYYFSPLCATTTVIDVVVDVDDAEVCSEMLCLCTKQIYIQDPVQIQAYPDYGSRPGHQCKGALPQAWTKPPQIPVSSNLRSES